MRGENARRRRFRVPSVGAPGRLPDAVPERPRAAPAGHRRPGPGSVPNPMRRPRTALSRHPRSGVERPGAVGAAADPMKVSVQKESACAARPHTRKQNRGTRYPWFETRRRRIPQDANGGAADGAPVGLASGDVESHFHVEGDLSDLGLGPGHVLAPSVKGCQPENQTIHSRMGSRKKKMRRSGIASAQAVLADRAQGWSALPRASPGAAAPTRPGSRRLLAAAPFHGADPGNRGRPETAPAGSC